MAAPAQQPEPDDTRLAERSDGVDAGEKPMGFLDHLEELRWTIIKSVIAFVIAFVISAVFFGRLKDVLAWPLNAGLGESTENFEAVTNTPLAVFSVFFAIPIIGAVALSLPFMLLFIAQFVAPALLPREKRLLIPGTIAAVVLFLGGALFSYFVLVPSVIRISVEWNAVLGTKLLWTIDKYYSMLMWMIIGMGAAFQFPLIIQACVILGLVTVEKLRSWRRIMILVCFILAAIITPTPDPINMTIVALPLWFLYEAAIVAASIYTRRRAKGGRS